jgi:hypothetical protein
MGAPSRYLTPGERLVYTCRRHSVVLGNSLGILAVAIGLGVFLGAMAPRRPTAHLGEIGVGIALAGAVYFGWRAWHWWLTRYVITNERIMLIEGLVARKVKSLPLRLVIDTSYQRTVGGRLLGYGDIEVNLSGQPGLRKLTIVPHADRVYRLILRLLSPHEASQPPATLQPLPPLALQDIAGDAGAETQRLPAIETHRLPPL